jgi:hypothetical protein
VLQGVSIQILLGFQTLFYELVFSALLHCIVLQRVSIQSSDPDAGLLFSRSSQRTVALHCVAEVSILIL